MKKRTMSMFQTLKVAVFGKVSVKGNTETPAFKVVDGHIVINDEICDLRTIKERFDPDTKELSPSAVDNILCAGSILTKHYGKCIGDRNVLFDFVIADCSGGNDYDPYVKQVKDSLCYDGLYLPLNKLEVVGFTPHDECEIIEIEGLLYVRYKTAMQSASENRQCKLTLTMSQSRRVHMLK